MIPNHRMTQVNTLEKQKKYAALDAIFAIRAAYCLLNDNFKLKKDDVKTELTKVVLDTCRRYRDEVSSLGVIT